MRTPYPEQEEALQAINDNEKLIINLPTGTGKSLIQAWAISQDIKANKGISRVNVVLAPRILLVSQLYADIKTDLVKIGIDVQYAIVNSSNHSDKQNIEWFKSIINIEKKNDIQYRELQVCKSVKALNELHDKCIAEKVSLVIIGNYQSASRIDSAKFTVNNLHCDEAHYLVPSKEEEDNIFSWIAEKFKAEKKYFYTATMRFTKGFLGMNNIARFGEVFSKKPAEMIVVGRIVRPRIHLVDVKFQDGMSEQDRDAIAIVDAFREHRAMIAANGIQHLAPKMLVIAKGTAHLNDLVSHPTIKTLMKDRKNLKIFDITSEHGARIDGLVVQREVFLKELKGLTDADEAIIFHIRILSEGIDVPGITGIMPLNNLKKAAFLQTLGRATRLHGDDRKRIDGNDMLPSELTRFVKPYAWIIIPIYEDIGEEMKEDFTEMIRELRTFGFKPSEDIFIKDSKGSAVAKPIGMTTCPNLKGKSYHQFFTFEVEHIIEEEEKAERIETIISVSCNIKTEDELMADLDKFITF